MTHSVITTAHKDNSHCDFDLHSMQPCWSWRYTRWMLFQGTHACSAYLSQVSLILPLFRKKITEEPHELFNLIFISVRFWCVLCTISCLSVNRSNVFFLSTAQANALVVWRALWNFSDVAWDGLKLIFAWVSTDARNFSSLPVRPEGRPWPIVNPCSHPWKE